MVINALMRDMFTKDEFSARAFVILVMTIAPLLAPMINGALLRSSTGHLLDHGRRGTDRFTAGGLVHQGDVAERASTAVPALFAGRFGSLFRHKRVLSYILASASLVRQHVLDLSAGPFVYIELNHVSPQHFGYYFALNIASSCS